VECTFPPLLFLHHHPSPLFPVCGHGGMVLNRMYGYLRGRVKGNLLGSPGRMAIKQVSVFSDKQLTRNMPV